jgi:hypothetical protein
MTFFRRSTAPPATNLSPSQPAPAAAADAMGTHEPGTQQDSTYAPSSGQGFSSSSSTVTPAFPAAARPSRTGRPTAPPALPSGALAHQPMTPESLNAWANEPGQSSGERRERARVVEKLTSRSYVGNRLLDLSGMKYLSSLPTGLSVDGSLQLRGCTTLTRLPEGLSVRGILFMDGCTALVHLPEGLSVEADVVLSDCTALARLPEGLSVGGDLILIGCPALTQLPTGLAVAGSLNLSDCTALTQLSEGLVVRFSLNLSGCASLTQLPETFYVERDMDLSGCTSLTQLPEGVLRWPLQNDGQPHIIDLSSSGIREDRIQALRDIAGAGVQLVYGVREERLSGDPQFADLLAAMAFWRPLAPSGAQNANPERSTSSDVHANPQQLTSFLDFLGRLRSTADFQNINSRPLLAQRIVGLTNQLTTSESLAAVCHERIGQALESCGDRVIWAMNQLELTVRVHQATQGGAPEQELRDLGRSLLRLQVVHQHAAAKVATLRVVDPIEVYLVYETRLAQPLGLPLSTQGMLYEHFSNITDADLRAASQAAKQADADPRQVEAYLATWEPWQGLLRRQQAKACTWQRLPPLPRGIKLDNTQVCIFTRETVANLRASGSEVAAVRGASGQWAPYDFDSLVQWWAQQGTHPVQRTPMRLEAIHRAE